MTLGIVLWMFMALGLSHYPYMAWNIASGFPLHRLWRRLLTGTVGLAGLWAPLSFGAADLGREKV